MKLPRIKALDLRPVPEFTDIEWDWPAFPERIQRFVDGGDFPTHSAKVTGHLLVEIVADVHRFQAALDRAAMIFMPAKPRWYRRLWNRVWR